VSLLMKAKVGDLKRQRLVALLRGVNVGGHGKLAMADLRQLTTDLGHTDVATYIQSGNLVFTTDRAARTVAARDTIARQLSSAIDERHHLKVSVMVRTVDELRKALAAVPFLGDEPDSAKLMIVFLSGRPTAKAIASLDADRFAPDRFHVIGREMFVHFPNGAGRSKFTTDYFEKRLGVSGTARNLNTVRKLIDLATD
jgi:uncharacterized protein (DUF1697 family)